MSKSYELQWSAHPNIHNDYSSRECKFHFTEPDKGVNSETGLLLIIPGFGADASSKVYKKMRDVFADEHNLVVVQCEYFGSEFMQSMKEGSFQIPDAFLEKHMLKEKVYELNRQGFELSKLIEMMKDSHLTAVPGVYKPNETINNFCDMGLMQAMDNLTSLYYVINILKENNLQFNENRIIVYGHSQGAYLAMLCNALVPTTFDLVIDNSSWTYPRYLKSNRVLTIQADQVSVQIIFDYLASKIKLDHEILKLPEIYKQFENSAKIITYQGVSDSLVSVEEKRLFCNQISNCDFNLVSREQVDGAMFKSTNHGLDADFLKLFNYSLKQADFKSQTKLLYTSHKKETDRAEYEVFFESGIPLLRIEFK